MPAAVRFRRLVLRSRDPAAQVAFLARALGADATRETSHHASHAASRTVLQAGATTLEFVAGTPRAVAHFAFNVAPHSLDRWAARLAGLDPPVALLADAGGRVRFPFASWRAEALYFRDPDGNVLELIAREDAPPPVTPDDVAGVSEFGMAVGDVAACARRIEAELGLPPYGRPSGEFCAMGDARGLLILVREGRAWFPENRASAHAADAELRMETPTPAELQIPAGVVRIVGVAGGG